MCIYRRGSFSFNRQQLEIIGKMYPYGVQYYPDLRAKTLEFLQTNFPDLPEDTRIFASSEHNGHGRQWGVILLNIPDQDIWELVGHFGHRLFMGGLAGRILRLSYFGLIWFGKTDVRWQEWRKAHGTLRPDETATLKSFLSECEWLDLRVREQRERWRGRRTSESVA